MVSNNMEVIIPIMLMTLMIGETHANPSVNYYTIPPPIVTDMITWGYQSSTVSLFSPNGVFYLAWCHGKFSNEWLLTPCVYNKVLDRPHNFISTFYSNPGSPAIGTCSTHRIGMNIQKYSNIGFNFAPSTGKPDDCGTLVMLNYYVQVTNLYITNGGLLTSYDGTVVFVNGPGWPQYNLVGYLTTTQMLLTTSTVGSIMCIDDPISTQTTISLYDQIINNSTNSIDYERVVSTTKTDSYSVETTSSSQEVGEIQLVSEFTLGVKDLASLRGQIQKTTTWTNSIGGSKTINNDTTVTVTQSLRVNLPPYKSLKINKMTSTTTLKTSCTGTRNTYIPAWGLITPAYTSYTNKVKVELSTVSWLVNN